MEKGDKMNNKQERLLEIADYIFAGVILVLIVGYFFPMTLITRNPIWLLGLLLLVPFYIVQKILEKWLRR